MKHADLHQIPTVAVVALLLGCAVFVSSACSAMKRGDRPRIIATTDGEIDDRCSMVRFLMYANEWDIEGIVYSASKFHWDNHKWAGTKWIEGQIDQYAKVYETLKTHAPGFPAPKELKGKITIGNIANVGEMGADTPGSERIVEVLLDARPGPVYLQAWGGTNTIARALWKIQHKHPDQMKKVSRKAVVYIILDQDNTFRQYIQPNWPDVQVLGSFRQFGCIAYRWNRIIPAPQKSLFEKPWMEANILKGHGPLCSLYESKDGAFRSEGDSPSFMHQICVGLRSLEHPSYGGWGGRFEMEKGAGNVWRGAKDDGDLNKPIWRWAEAFQNDWAARADWCVKPRSKANHPPAVELAHSQDIEAAPGAKVTLSAKGTTDPDGNNLTYRWWAYKEPSSYGGKVTIEDAEKRDASFKVPDDAQPGRTVHVICEVTDDGTPPLTRYRRVIVTVVNPSKRTKS